VEIQVLNDKNLCWVSLSYNYTEFESGFKIQDKAEVKKGTHLMRKEMYWEK
jgi:hypothetical protein